MPKSNPKVGERYQFHARVNESKMFDKHTYVVQEKEDRDNLILINEDTDNFWERYSVFGDYKSQFELIEGVDDEEDDEKSSYEIKIEVNITVNEV